VGLGLDLRPGRTLINRKKLGALRDREYLSASRAEERDSGDLTYRRVGAGRRAMGFVLGVALTSTGGLASLPQLYLWGCRDTIALLSFMMIGSGTLMLPTAIFGRRDW
jgi:hypothetical protein